MNPEDMSFYDALLGEDKVNQVLAYTNELCDTYTSFFESHDFSIESLLIALNASIVTAMDRCYEVPMGESSEVHTTLLYTLISEITAMIIVVREKMNLED